MMKTFRILLPNLTVVYIALAFLSTTTGFVYYYFNNYKELYEVSVQVYVLYLLFLLVLMLGYFSRIDNIEQELKKLIHDIPYTLIIASTIIMIITWLFIN